jgi:hypothetical protein
MAVAKEVILKTTTGTHTTFVPVLVSIPVHRVYLILNISYLCVKEQNKRFRYRYLSVPIGFGFVFG